MSESDSKLNHKRYLFCLEYIKDYNGTQAAIRAGYSKNTATEQASQLLTNLNVKDTIAELEQDRLDVLRITGEKVIKNIVRLSEKAESKDDINAALRAQALLGRGKLWEKGGGGIKNISSNPDGTMNISFEEDGPSNNTD